MADLDHDTQLSSLDDGSFSVRLSPDWTLWGPNGGYLAAIALRAAGRLARIARPASLHVHYVRAAKVELPVVVRVQVIQSGQKAESLSVLMEQDGKPVLTALVRTVACADGLEHADVVPPAVVEPLQAIEAAAIWPEHFRHYPFWENFDRRVVQPEAWAASRAPMTPRWREWFRYRTQLRSDPFLDAAQSVLLIDTLCWPAAWLLHGDERFIAPSLDLTVWFHRSPPSEWLLADAHSPAAQAGLISGFCQIWSQSRELLASGGSQLLCVPNGR